eukprot:Sspe_Gene.3908::Locus_1303_Transcript_1_1_Confidence_1.000_Length_1550::g.3908::m.3908/K12348/ASAH1; acid ceramidase
MIRLLLVLLLVGGVLGKEKCNIGEYPVTYPPTMKNMTIPTVDIDLDAPPAERWVHAVAPLKEEVKRLIYTFLNHSLANPSKPIGKVVKKFLDFGVEDWLIRLPAPYPEEIRSIAKAIDMDVAYVAVYQMAYELEGACTSIVAQDGKGQIWHARNLDFGLFSGWNASEPVGGWDPGGVGPHGSPAAHPAQRTLDQGGQGSLHLDAVRGVRRRAHRDEAGSAWDQRRLSLRPQPGQVHDRLAAGIVLWGVAYLHDA